MMRCLPVPSSVHVFYVYFRAFFFVVVFFFTPKSDAAGWVIHEIYASPRGAGGDATGDGRTDPVEDEFVELVNTSDAVGDLSGWALFDGAGVRHVFPPDSVVARDCAVVVFGGGPFLASFGGARVQEASTGRLGLDNSGDTVLLRNPRGDTAASAAYGGDVPGGESLTLDLDGGGASFVRHKLAPGAAGVPFSPGVRADGSPFPGCLQAPPVAEVWEIQGSGMESPYAYQHLETRENVVTAVGPEGFFLQTPEARSDGDPLTSDGIYVFTGSRPDVRAGDLADVWGLVTESFGLTELGAGPELMVRGRGHSLPAPVRLDAGRPSPGKPRLEAELERYEGMLVELSGGTVTGPSDRFGEMAIVARRGRAFREPGIAYPGLPGLPVWDGNPEVFGLDPDALGGPELILPACAAVTYCAGPLAFAFGEYQVWPVSLDARWLLAARPVRDRAPGELTVATQNLHNLFDDRNDPFTADPTPRAAEYELRLGKHSLAIREVLRSPDILTVEEAENLEVLDALAGRIRSDDSGVRYRPFLLEGSDPRGIDVGFLVRDTVDVREVFQIGAAATFEHRGETWRTFPRPPLFLRASLPGGGELLELQVIAVHLRSLLGIEEDDFVPVQRKAQAAWLARAVQDLETREPEGNILVTGDFNAFEFTDGYADVIGEITGRPDPLGALLPAGGRVEPRLRNQVFRLPPRERYSYVFRGNAQALDHMLASETLERRVSGIRFGRGNADAPYAFAQDGTTALRASDHDGLVLYIAAGGPAPFVRGDVNADGLIDVADPLALVNYLVNETALPPCRDAADADGDGELLLLDAVRLLALLYRGAGPLPEPFPGCAPLSPDCGSFPACR